MTDRIHVQPAHLRQAAAHHQQTADYLRTVPSSHDAIRESLDSLGPIFSELRDTGRELLELRKQCYQHPHRGRRSQVLGNIGVVVGLLPSPTWPPSPSLPTGTAAGSMWTSPMRWACSAPTGEELRPRWVSWRAWTW